MVRIVGIIGLTLGLLYILSFEIITFNLKEEYEDKVIPMIMKKLNYTSIFSKIVISLLFFLHLYSLFYVNYYLEVYLDTITYTLVPIVIAMLFSKRRFYDKYSEKIKNQAP